MPSKGCKGFGFWVQHGPQSSSPAQALNATGFFEFVVVPLVEHLEEEYLCCY